MSIGGENETNIHMLQPDTTVHEIISMLTENFINIIHVIQKILKFYWHFNNTLKKIWLIVNSLSNIKMQNLIKRYSYFKRKIGINYLKWCRSSLKLHCGLMWTRYYIYSRSNFISPTKYSTSTIEAVLLPDYRLWEQSITGTLIERRFEDNQSLERLRNKNRNWKNCYIFIRKCLSLFDINIYRTVNNKRFLIRENNCSVIRITYVMHHSSFSFHNISSMMKNWIPVRFAGLK